MRRLLCAFLACLALGTTVVAVAPEAQAACGARMGGTSGGSCESKLSWSYNAAKRQFERGSGIRSQAPDDPYEYHVRIDCEANTRGSTHDTECGRARTCPVILDDDGSELRGRRILPYRRLKTAAPNGAWLPHGESVCEYSGKTVPMADVVAAARQHLEKAVGNPTITAQPPNHVTLVTFVSLFHAPLQQVTSLAITTPVTGELTGQPAYHWDLDDGITDRGAGHPYASHVDPKSPSTDDYYVKAAYTTRGRKNITLTLTWNVSMTLGGAGTVQLDPIVFTANDYTEAKEKRAVLVNN